MRGIFSNHTIEIHLQLNAGAYVPKQGMRMEVAAIIRSMFNAQGKRILILHLSETGQHLE